MALFLTPTELRELTGYALKARQITQLRKMGIPFRVNGCGRAVVTRLSIEGYEPIAPSSPSWKPSVLQNNRREV